MSTRPCESPDVVIVRLRATHRVAPTILAVKGGLAVNVYATLRIARYGNRETAGDPPGRPYESRREGNCIRDIHHSPHRLGRGKGGLRRLAAMLSS